MARIQRRLANDGGHTNHPRGIGGRKRKQQVAGVRPTAVEDKTPD
jgi:hypothetical protein